MNNEFRRLLKYCEDNDIKVVFVDSAVSQDYGELNSEAVKGFSGKENNAEVTGIVIDESLPEETQIRNLKHELIKRRLIEGGMEYQDAYTIACVREKEPFDFSKPMHQEVNMIQVGRYDNRSQQSSIPPEEEEPVKKGWHRRFPPKPKTGIVGSK